MKAKHTKIILLFLGLIATGIVRADVIVDNLDQPTFEYYGPIGNDSNLNDFLIGQEFIVPGGATPFHLDKVTLLLQATGNANITVSIWRVDSNNNPTNEIAVVSTQLVVNNGSTTNVDFIPTNDITLPPGIYYVVASPATSADNGLVNWAYTSLTNATGTGALGPFAETSSGAWENSLSTGVFVNYPQQMSVQATPITPTIGISPAATGVAI
ncbi:MAG TPA: choice-of-anchor R domain-containing protein, partial [Candidatus Saccharimonadales bacterium]|nr:choice-of-anchor R domain-containing protein [Candidatus Saccharimonadales bacterium]